jgi:hypothetical protein
VWLSVFVTWIRPRARRAPRGSGTHRPRP